MRTLKTERVRVLVAGRPAVTDLPVIPAGAPPALAEGLRRRRVAALRGRCQCGARRQGTALARGDLAAAGAPAAHLPFAHTADCPAHADRLAAALAAWQQRKE